MSLFIPVREADEKKWEIRGLRKMRGTTRSPQNVEILAEDSDGVLLAIAYLDWEFPSTKANVVVRNGLESAISVCVVIAAALASFTLILVQFLR